MSTRKPFKMGRWTPEVRQRVTEILALDSHSDHHTTPVAPESPPSPIIEELDDGTLSSTEEFDSQPQPVSTTLPSPQSGAQPSFITLGRIPQSCINFHQEETRLSLGQLQPTLMLWK